MPLATVLGISAQPLPDGRLEIIPGGQIYLPLFKAYLKPGHYIDFDDGISWSGYVLSIDNGIIRGFICLFNDLETHEVYQTDRFCHQCR